MENLKLKLLYETKIEFDFGCFQIIKVYLSGSTDKLIIERSNEVHTMSNGFYTEDLKPKKVNLLKI